MRGTMRAMVLHEYGKPFKLEAVPIPQPGPHDALVKVKACGSGLTIHHTKMGTSEARLPIIIGHEIAGEVVEIGEHVTEVNVGDRVTPHFYLTCGHCKWCLLNRETLCEQQMGYIGRQINGGYAEYCVLPARNLVKIPDGLPYDERPGDVAVICDAILTPYKVTRRARIAPLETVMVIGAGGGVGIHMVGMAKFKGARVIAVDVGEEKLSFCRRAGADEVIDASKQSIEEEVRRLTDGKGVDVVVEFVARPETLEASFNSLGTGGRLVILGVYRGSPPFRVNPSKALRGELEVLGSRYASKQELAESLELVRRGYVKPIVTRTFKLEEAEEAHRLLGEGAILGRAAIVF